MGRTGGSIDVVAFGGQRPVLAMVALIGRDEAQRAVEVLEVIPAHEILNPSPRLVDDSEAAGGQLGTYLQVRNRASARACCWAAASLSEPLPSSPLNTSNRHPVPPASGCTFKISAGDNCSDGGGVRPEQGQSDYRSKPIKQRNMERGSILSSCSLIPFKIIISNDCAKILRKE